MPEPDRGALARRVLHLVHWLAPGGMEGQLLELARGLSLRGREVTVGFFEAMDVDHRPFVDDGVRLVRLGSSGRMARMAAAGRIARLARRHDVVHCTGWDASLWGRIGGAIGRRPVVITDHSVDRTIHLSSSGRSRATAVAWHNRLLDPVTYATVAVAERQLSVLHAEGVSPSKVVVIPNGVAIGRLRDAARPPADRAALGVPAGAKLIVHVARFGAMKRQLWTYEAVARLRRHAGDVHVAFAGRTDDEQFERVRARATEDGATWAHFLGVRDDVPALLAAADLAVLPSSSEALPMSIIEAMAVGVPQVATDVGDVGTLLRDTGAGIVVPVDDAGAFERGCGEVLTDEALAGRLAQAGHRASKRFDSAAMIDAYAALFDSAAAGTPTPSGPPDTWTVERPSSDGDRVADRFYA